MLTCRTLPRTPPVFGDTLGDTPGTTETLFKTRLPPSRSEPRKLYQNRGFHDPELNFVPHSIVRGLLGTGPPGPTLESTSPSPPQGTIWHRFNIDSTLIRHRNRVKSGNRCRINVESMLNRPLRRGGRGGFEGGAWGACAY